MPATELDSLSINTIRFLSVDAVQKANSGHPGLPMGAAPMAYVLWTRFLKHDPGGSRAGPTATASCCRPATARCCSTRCFISPATTCRSRTSRSFRQWGSRTPGHPESHLTPGVEATTGPLGQGISNAVGMAIAEAHLAARFNRPGHAKSSTTTPTCWRATAT